MLVSFTSCNEKTDSVPEGSAAVSSSNGSEIVIGEVGSLTGTEATFGTSTRDGIDLAIKQINAAGGIKGKKMRVIVIDDQGKSEEAATAVTKLITQDKVSAILGEVGSTRSLAMAPIAQGHHVPMITPSSTAVEVTQKGDFIFRVCFIDPFQGWAMAQFAAKTLKVKKAAILRDVKSDYSVGLANIFTEIFKKLGGEIVMDQSYSGGDADFKSQLTSIKTKNPDVIYVPGYYTEVGLIARQTRELGIKAPLIGGDGWDSAKLTEIGGPALDGSFFSNHYTPDDKSAIVQKFITDFKKDFNQVPDGLAAMGYDAAIVLADAMKRAKSLSGDDIRSALAETKDYQAVTGKITIDKNRDASKAAVVIEIKGGKFVLKETINPPK
ncbi:MAG: ABC transporter substrate-binding protein [Deltaproteobacteria bacterium]|nr:ABC transporter substrate-binding protein [Deltaproteobacteria bacterium]